MLAQTRAGSVLHYFTVMLHSTAIKLCCCPTLNKKRQDGVDLFVYFSVFYWFFTFCLFFNTKLYRSFKHALVFCEDRV